jgi:hypothetical protein
VPQYRLFDQQALVSLHATAQGLGGGCAVRAPGRLDPASRLAHMRREQVRTGPIPGLHGQLLDQVMQFPDVAREPVGEQAFPTLVA